MSRLLLLPAFIVVGIGAVYIAQHQNASTPEMSRCIDTTGHVVDGTLCAIRPQPMQVRGTLHPQPMYHTYYGGFGSYDAGSRAWGGSDYALPGHRYQTAAALEPTPSYIENSPQPYVAYRSH